MTEHTPEPWFQSGVAIGGDEDGTLVHNGIASAVPELSLERRKADARRIVACVNACAGIPTAALELASVKALVDDLVYALEYGPDCAVDNKLHANRRDAILKRLTSFQKGDSRKRGHCPSLPRRS